MEMNYQLIVCFQLAYITPSILLYFIEFCYIFASKHAEYKSAFYYIFLIRAPADMMQVIVRLIAHHFPIIGWLTVINIPYIAKIGLIIEAEYLVLLELIAHLILSINRFTGIYYPVKYNHWWTPRNTIMIFVACDMIALVEPIVRLHQEFAFVDVDGAVTAYAVNPSYQKRNLYVSSSLYMFFAVTSLILNSASLRKHSQQRKAQFFDVKQTFANAVQFNLLVYSSSFTAVVVSMTVLQGLILLHVLPSKIHEEVLFVVVLTFTRDALALSNPWLLLILTKSFRSRFLNAVHCAALNRIPWYFREWPR